MTFKTLPKDSEQRMTEKQILVSGRSTQRAQTLSGLNSEHLTRLYFPDLNAIKVVLSVALCPSLLEHL